MRSTIVSATDREQWCAMMQRADAGDVYFLPEYHRLYEFMGVDCLAFAASDGADHLFYPFLLRPVGLIGMIDAPDGWNDIETVYGYSGPFATITSPAFLAEAWRGFEDWCREHNVVCEFLRFNPILRSERFASPEMGVSLNSKTVEIRLEGFRESTLTHHAAIMTQEWTRVDTVMATWQVAPDLTQVAANFLGR